MSLFIPALKVSLKLVLSSRMHEKTRHLNQGVRDLIRMLMTYLQVFSQPCCFSLISTGYPFPSKSPEITRQAAFLWGLFVRRLTR